MRCSTMCIIVPQRW